MWNITRRRCAYDTPTSEGLENLKNPASSGLISEVLRSAPLRCHSRTTMFLSIQKNSFQVAKWRGSEEVNAENRLRLGSPLHPYKQLAGDARVEHA